MRIRGDVRILHYVLDIAVVSENRPNRPVKALIVPAHENLIKVHIPAQNALDHLCVGDLRVGRPPVCEVHFQSPQWNGVCHDKKVTAARNVTESRLFPLLGRRKKR